MHGYSRLKKILLRKKNASILSGGDLEGGKEEDESGQRRDSQGKRKGNSPEKR